MTGKRIQAVQRLAVAGAAVLAGLAWASAAHAVTTTTTRFAMPVELQAQVSTFDCENSPGPQITFEGAMVLGGVDVRMIFRNNINNDVHTYVEDVQVAGAVAAGETIVIPKQPVHGGTGGNPFIWIQMVDGNGQPLTGEIFLGRCVQGAFGPTASFVTPVVAQAVVEALDCTNNPGPFINVGGSASFSPGVKARFIFRNNDNPVGGPHEADAVVDVTVIPEGFTLTFPKQPVLGGVGGNPWISVQFASPGGDPYGNETLLGRCVQLMPGN
jgi:hypothetical protein